MKVNVRAVIPQAGRIVVSRERRRGIEHILLPGGRVRNGETIDQALVREVCEETGLAVVADRLLYVAEVVGMYGVHDLLLVWLAHPTDPQQSIDPEALVSMDSPVVRSVMPPIMDEIDADISTGWPGRPRWLGNVRRPARRPGPPPNVPG